jgi:hypothetical protein
MDEKTIHNIKQDYIRQLNIIYPPIPNTDKNSIRNMENVQNCKFVFNPKFGGHASTDYESNTVTYGPQIDERIIYHELDHIRKGKCERSVGIETYITPDNKCKFEKSQYGIFFNETITECLAVYMYRNSKFYDRITGEQKLNRNNNYKTQLEILDKIAQEVNVHPLEFCQMIDFKHHFDDKTIDEKFESITGDKNYFKYIEGCLDYFASAQVAELECKLGNVRSADGSLVAADICDFNKEAAKLCYEKAISKIDNIFEHRQTPAMDISK